MDNFGFLIGFIKYILRYLLKESYLGSRINTFLGEKKSFYMLLIIYN